MKKPAKKTCPVCCVGYQAYPAISRFDNKTEVCPDCGVVEAFGGPIIQEAQELQLTFALYATAMRQHYKHPFIQELLKAQREAAKLLLVPKQKNRRK